MVASLTAPPSRAGAAGDVGLLQPVSMGLDGMGRDRMVVLNPAPRRGRAGATASGKANSCEVPAVNVVLMV